MEKKMNDKIMKAFAKMLESTMNPMPNHCVECDKPTQETLCSECMAKEDDVEVKIIGVKNGKNERKIN